MSLRFRLICLIAIVLVVSLAVEGAIVFFNASHSVRTEMNSALQVGQQIVGGALARLPDSNDRRRDLEDLVAAFKGNRHLRVSLTGGGAADPSLEWSHFGTAPPWVVRLLGAAPIAARIFAVNVDLAAISRLAGQGRCGEIAGQIPATSEAVSHLQRQIRTMLGRLRPGVLADFGLAAAIMSMVEFWGRRHPGTRFKASLPPAGASFGALIDITIYRIVQESLCNAVRHGNPAEISVSVTSAATEIREPDCITVEVANDGHAMDETAGFGFELIAMQERVHALGGSLVLTQEPGLGFLVSATLPAPTRSDQVLAAWVSNRFRASFGNHSIKTPKETKIRISSASLLRGGCGGC